MKFNDYPDLFTVSRRSEPDMLKDAKPDTFYHWLLQKVRRESARGKASPVYQGVSRSETEDQLMTESNWYADGRPYYNVWPVITRSFLKLDLDKVPSESLRFPTSPLLFRFAESDRVGLFESEEGAFWIRSMLFARYSRVVNPETKQPVPGRSLLLLFADFGEHLTKGDAKSLSVCSWLRFPSAEGMSVGESWNITLAGLVRQTIPGVQVPPETHRASLQILAACGLLEEDSDVVMPDVLNADKDRYRQTRDPAIFEKAKRRGKYGWSIGEELQQKAEMAPGFRIPHPAVYWTGKGGATAAIRFRQGDAPGGFIRVRHDKLQKVPTGHIDEEPPCPK